MPSVDAISPDLRKQLRNYIDNFERLSDDERQVRLADQVLRFNEPGDTVLLKAEVVQAFAGELELRVPSPNGSTRFWVRTRETVTL